MDFSSSMWVWVLSFANLAVAAFALRVACAQLRHAKRFDLAYSLGLEFQEDKSNSRDSEDPHDSSHIPVVVRIQNNGLGGCQEVCV